MGVKWIDHDESGRLFVVNQAIITFNILDGRKTL